MKKKIRVWALTGMMLTGALLAGCSGGNQGGSAAGGGEAPDNGQQAQTEQAKDGTKTIKWITQGPGEDSWEGKTRPILEQFEKDTGIKVEAEFYSFGDLFDVLETKAAAKSTDFDLMSVDVTFVAKYATSGYLTSLDSYFSQPEKDQFDEASYAAGVWDDTMYAAPSNTSTQLLFYNQKLLDEAGITIRDNDENNRLTYEEVAALAKEALDVLDPDRTQGYIGFDFQQVSRVYQMNMLANSMGGQNIGPDGFTVDGVINTEPWEKAMTWYQNLVKDGIATRGYAADQLGAQFESGKMVFMIGGAWTPSNMLVDDEIGYTYAPCFAGHEDQAATSTGSWYLGINSQSPNQDAAAEFVKYMTLGKGSDMWLVANGDVPSRLAKQKEIEENPEASKLLKIAAYEAANTAVPRAVTPAFGEYSAILDQTWEDVRNGVEVKEALQSAVDQINAATANYKK